MDILFDDPDISALFPLGRRGTKTELAHAATFLFSDSASYITGPNLSQTVDGRSGDSDARIVTLVEEARIRAREK